MQRKVQIEGWIKVVVLLTLLILLWGGCGKKKIDQAKDHVKLGVQYLEENQLEKALAELEEALKLDPNNADAHFYLGGLYHSGRAYSLALKEYEQVLRINPYYPRIHTAFGNLYYEKGLKAWRRAAKLDRLTYWLPDTLRQLPFKNREELTALLEKYLTRLETDTADAETFSRTSQAYLLLAEEEYLKAIQADSLDTTAQLYLGLTYSEQGYPYKAKAQYEILKRLDSNSADLLLSMLEQKEKEKKEIEELKKGK